MGDRNTHDDTIVSECKRARWDYHRIHNHVTDCLADSGLTLRDKFNVRYKSPADDSRDRSEQCSTPLPLAAA